VINLAINKGAPPDAHSASIVDRAWPVTRTMAEPHQLLTSTASASVKEYHGVFSGWAMRNITRTSSKQHHKRLNSPRVDTHPAMDVFRPMGWPATVRAREMIEVADVAIARRRRQCKLTAHLRHGCWCCPGVMVARRGC
jgi:hypothetical protein